MNGTLAIKTNMLFKPHDAAEGWFVSFFAAPKNLAASALRHWGSWESVEYYIETYGIVPPGKQENKEGWTTS